MIGRPIEEGAWPVIAPQPSGPVDANETKMDISATCAGEPQTAQFQLGDDTFGPEHYFETADVLDDRPDSGAVADAAENPFVCKPEEAITNYVSWGNFKMDPKKGLRTLKRRSDKDEPNAKPCEQWICAPFEILGATRDPQGRAWGKWIRWRDPDGRVHCRHVADAKLHGEPGAACQALADEGLRIAIGGHKALVTYLSGSRVAGRVSIVHHTGWHEIGGQSVFVLPEEAIAPRHSETVILNTAINGPYQRRGSLADWQNNVAALLQHLPGRSNREGDSQGGTNRIQGSHWAKEASHEWRSRTPMICANVSLRRLKPVIPRGSCRLVRPGFEHRWRVHQA
jgi:hypothetical protein